MHIVVAADDRGAPFMMSTPRPAMQAAVAVTVLALIGVASLITDDVIVRRSRLGTAALEQRLTEAHELNDTLHADLDAIRKEMVAWPSLEKQILAPFDRAPIDPVAAASGDDADALAAVRRSTGTLRDVATVTTRLHDVLAHLPSRSPVVAAINSPFGARRSPTTGETEFHPGVDIAARDGTAVRAPAPGDVVFTGGRGDYGLTVIVEHGAGVRTLYGHLSRVSVRAGDRIERGQIVGRSGNTGPSTGAHLHYEVQVSGRPVDPRPFLWN